jgi:hypothetical protein
LIPDGLLRPGTPGTGPGANPAPTKAEEDKADNVKRDGEPPLGKIEEPAAEEEVDVKENESGAVDAGHMESSGETEMVVEREKMEEGEEKGMEEQTASEVVVSSSTSHDDAETVEAENDDMPGGVEQVVDSEKALEGNDKGWEEVRAEDVNIKTDEEVKNLESDGSNEAFVGDTTWEERTWKELVRLREEMFWARVGALRQ